MSARVLDRALSALGMAVTIGVLLWCAAGVLLYHAELARNIRVGLRKIGAAGAADSTL